MKAPEFQVEERGRLDTLLRRYAELSNKKVREVIRTGKVFLDGNRILDPATQLQIGQTLRLDWAAPNPRRNNPHGLELVYRDADLLVVNKPAGLLSTPTSEARSLRRLLQGPDDSVGEESHRWWYTDSTRTPQDSLFLPVARSPLARFATRSTTIS